MPKVTKTSKISTRAPHSYAFTYLQIFLNNVMIYGREKRAMERQKRMQLILLGMSKT